MNPRDSLERASTTTPRELTPVQALFNDVCSQFLLFQRAIALYPHHHPRVQNTLESIQGAIVEYHATTGVSFCINSTPDAVQARADTCGSSDFERVAQILQTNFIEQLEIGPEVTREELLQVCNLMRGERDEGGSLATEEDAEDLTFDPQRWANVSLSFFLPRDIDAADLTGDTLLEHVTGLHRVRDLRSLLKTAPRNVRSSLHSALLRPGLVQRITDLQQHLVYRAEDSGAAAERGDVDVVTAIIGSFVEKSARDGERTLSDDEIVSALENLIQFLERNVSGLSSVLQSYPTDADTKVLEDQIHDVVANGFELSEQVNQVQFLKEKLAFLFQISPGDPIPEDISDPVPTHARPAAESPSGETASSDRQASRPEAREGAQPVTSLDESLAAISYDIKELAREIRRVDPSLECLKVILEELGDDARARIVREKWKAILKNFREFLPGPTSVKRSIVELARFLRDETRPEAEELMIFFMGLLDLKKLETRICERLLQLPHGDLLVQSFLDRSAKAHGEDCINFLNRLGQSQNGTLRRLVGEQVLSMVHSPARLSQWARLGDSILFRADLLGSVLETVSSDVVKKAFKAVFREADLPEVRRILGSVPPTVPGAERISFVALDHAPEETHDHVIRQLGRFPTTVVVSTLVGIVDENNHRNASNTSRVSAAFRALAMIGDSRVKRYFDRVLNERNVFMHIYRREIRRALEDVLQEGEAVL